MKQKMWKWWQVFLDLFYPRRCLGCGCKLEQERLLCQTCWRQEFYLRVEAPQQHECRYLQEIVLLFRYTQGVKLALHQLKYQGRRELLPLLAAEVCRCRSLEMVLERWRRAGELIVIPIPTAHGRRRQRGYDLPTGIFTSWCQAHELSWVEGLERVRETEPQYGLDKEERQVNVQGCFQACAKVQGKQIILVDDIFTSGATMEEAARVLQQAGAGRVYALSFASGK